MRVEFHSGRFRLGLLLALVGVTVVGCDGYIGVEGRVYEAVQPTSRDSGFAVVDSLDRVLPQQLKPIAGAEVLVEPWRPEERANIGRPELWTERATTDSGGYFLTGTTAKPGKYDATITVRCPGFQEVQTIFRHDRFRHQAIVVLLREAQP
jgi:hypothetical protein